jgi:hypothetical protein
MKNQAYTEHFRDGMRAALNLTRAQANVYANALPVRRGDAFLAGYYAELRRLKGAPVEDRVNARMRGLASALAAKLRT